MNPYVPMGTFDVFVVVVGTLGNQAADFMTQQTRMKRSLWA